MDELPRFRAPKRRKANKPAVSEDGLSGDDSHPTRGIPHTTTDEAHNEENESALVRAHRKHTSLRRGGMSFTATTVTSSQQHPGESSLVLAEVHASDTTPQRQDRFVAPTGQVVNVDRHMYVNSPSHPPTLPKPTNYLFSPIPMLFSTSQTNPANIGRTAYIDSRLSRQQQGIGDNNQQEGHLITRDAFHGRHDDQKSRRSESQTLPTAPSTRSSTVMHGNSASSVQAYLLSEVAIPKIGSATDAAAASASAGIATPASKVGGPVAATVAAAAAAAKSKGPATARKLKPGRGKPRRPRQRPEQDIARDALVEKLLAEHAPGGHYLSAAAGPGPGPGPGSGSGEPGTGNAKEGKEDEEGKETEKESDEAFAARFRAAFFDRASERRGRGGGGSGGAAAAAGGGGGGSAADKDKTKTSSGPKLGGSRSDKAKLAMVMAKKQQRAGGGGAGSALAGTRAGAGR